MACFHRITTTPFFALAALLLLQGLAGCSSASIEDSSLETSAALEGDFVAFGGVMDDGRLVERCALRAEDGQETVLHFAHEPGLSRGTRLKVRGKYTGGQELRVHDFDVVVPERDGLGAVQQPVTVVNGVTTRRAAILKVYWNTTI